VPDDRARVPRKPDLFRDLLVTPPNGTVDKHLGGPVKVSFTVTRRS